MTPLVLASLLFSSPVPPDFVPVDWRSLPTRPTVGALAARSAATAPRVLKLLVVPMSYADQDSTFGKDTLSRVFDGPTPYVSINRYFAEQSGGQFQVEATFLPWQKVSLTTAEGYSQSETFCKYRFRNEAAAAAQRLGVKLSDFDNNKDGVLDGLAIIYAGRSTQETGDTSLFQNSVVTWATRLDTSVGGQNIRQALFVSEIRYGHPSPVGPFAHEIAHLIGASDLYDADPTLFGQSGGLGAWDLMSSGSHGIAYSSSNPEAQGPWKPTGITGWVREDVGFAQPDWVDSEQDLRIRPGEIRKVWIDPLRTRQYLYLENRSRAGVDSILPAPGLFVTRLRTAKIPESSYGIAYGVNDDPNDMGYMVMEASGEQRVAKLLQRSVLAKDLYGTGGADSLTDAGPVSLRLSDSSASEASLSQIRVDGEDIVLHVKPSPNRGYSLSTRMGPLGTWTTQRQRAMYIVRFVIPKAGKVVALQQTLAQGAGPNTIQLWPTATAMVGGGSPLFSASMSGSPSTGYKTFWKSLPQPVDVKAGDSMFVAVQVGTDSLSRLLAANYKTTPSNLVYLFQPDSNRTRPTADYAPIVDLVIQTPEGTTSLGSLRQASGLRGRWNGNLLSLQGAEPMEDISLSLLDLGGRRLWTQSVRCDAAGNAQVRPSPVHGVAVLDIEARSGRQRLVRVQP